MLWGLLHGVYLVTSILTLPVRTRLHEFLGLARMHRVHRIWRSFVTFHLVLFSWVLFRANSLSDVGILLRAMFRDFRLLDPALFQPMNAKEVIAGAVAILVMEFFHVCQSRGSVEQWLYRRPLPVRWAAYCGLLLCIVAFGKFISEAFIYFQF